MPSSPAIPPSKLPGAATISYGPPTPALVQTMIAKECDELKELLLSKNQGYGNSVMDPVKVFTQVGTMERIRSRLDDKICRIQRGEGSIEDSVHDLMGYLVLYRVAEKLGLE